MPRRLGVLPVADTTSISLEYLRGGCFRARTAPSSALSASDHTSDGLGNAEGSHLILEGREEVLEWHPSLLATADFTGRAFKATWCFHNPG